MIEGEIIVCTAQGQTSTTAKEPLVVPKELELDQDLEGIKITRYSIAAGRQKRRQRLRKSKKLRGGR